MYACAKALASVPSLHNLVYISQRSPYYRKGIIRGALTDGAEWIFLVLAINDNGDGAKYWLFRGISVLTKFPPCEVKVMAPWPGVVAGILARLVGTSPFIGPTFKMSSLTHGHDSR